MAYNGEVLKGEFVCSDCEHENTWVHQYQESNPMDAQNYDVVKYYKAKPNETWLKFDGTNSSAYCNECGKLNFFEVTID